MKIIHLNHSDINGGAAIAAYRIHQSLIKNGVNSKMWVDKVYSDDWTVVGPKNNIEKALVEIKGRFIRKSILKTLISKNKIIHSLSLFPSKWVRYINESDADIVNLHWIQNEMLSVKDISKIKKPIVWTLHDMWAFCGAEHYTNENRWKEGYKFDNKPSHERGFDLNRWTWMRKQKHWKNLIQIITPSSWLANCVQESKLMSDWPVSVIPNPLNTEIFKPIDKKIARKQLNLPSDKKLILFGASGGTKDPRKGFDLLIEAFKHLKNDNKAEKLELVIFGQSKPKLTPRLGFPIHYMGHFNDEISLSLVYSAANVIVVPSKIEVFGQTATEAQAFVTPAVVFDKSGLIDTVQHKKTGYIAESFDTKDLANGINFVLDQIDSGSLGKEARQRILDKFSYAIISEKYRSIYEKVLYQK